MKGSPNKIHLTLLATLLICTAGIFRHDVAESVFIKLAQEPQFNPVGLLKSISDNESGSCVLISETKVLTAAHCLIEYSQKDTTLIIGSQMVNTFITTGGYIPENHMANFVVQFGARQYKIKNITPHPDYNWQKAFDNDLIILELEEPVKGIKPAVLYNGNAELGMIAVGVGFGVNGNSNEFKSLESIKKKIAGKNTIDSIGGYAVNGKSQYGLLLTDFDHPTDPKYNKLGSAKPLKLEYVGTSGDSGGGLFIKSGKQWQLAGILSMGSTDVQSLMANKNYYGRINGYTRVSAHIDWITKEAGL